ncbi:hypothetical protein [Streptosporangium minutum]|uniref:Cell division protein DivIVA n=1 Tax=Streptosporangium minutum TaxID=569862 RepID=A0A243RJB8_9ACTN|nr:hypothetical protein [Streptosporangium minutum]OUC94992.1 hypothetical protein CA984_20250 [Streptosporangium minutum]
MLVVLALAAVAILVGVVVVAMGGGGELSEFAPDVPPLDLPVAGPVGAADLMALQLPVSLVGYHTQSVDETLNRVVNALGERDTRIAVLEQRVSELLASRLQARQEIHAGPLTAPRTEHEPEGPAEFPELSEAPPESLAARDGDGEDVRGDGGGAVRKGDGEDAREDVRDGDRKDARDGDGKGDGVEAREDTREDTQDGDRKDVRDGDGEDAREDGRERDRLGVPDAKEIR